MQTVGALRAWSQPMQLPIEVHAGDCAMAPSWLTSPWHVAHCALALRQMHALLRPAGRLFASFTIHVFGTGDFAAVVWERREDTNPPRRSA